MPVNADKSPAYRALQNRQGRGQPRLGRFDSFAASSLSYSAGGARRSRSQSAAAVSSHSPDAMPSTARSASSTSGIGDQLQPLTSMNNRSETQAARLLRSGSGWFFASLTMRTAALSTKSG